MNKFLSLDSVYIVTCNTQLNSFDRKIMSALYQPIIGYRAMSLYFTLWSEVEIDRVYSNASYFKRLSKIMSMDLKSIIDSFNVLEALGLVSTFYKKESERELYNIKIASPEVPQTFFKNPLLVNNLKNSLGNDDYIKTKMFFQKCEKSTDSYKDVSKKYQDVFTLNSNSSLIANDELYKKYNYAKIQGEVDLNAIKEALRPHNLHYLILDKKVCDTIEMLLLAYNVTTSDLIDSFIECSNNQKVDLDELVKNIETKDKIRQYKTNLDLVYLKVSQASNKYEKNSVYDFLKKYYKSLKIDNDLLQNLENAMKDYDIKTGACNLLIEFVINRIGILNINYFKTIASQWQQEGIDTYDLALSKMKKIKEKSSNSKFQKNKVVIGDTNEWYKVDDNIERAVSDEELAEVKEMFK